MKKTIWILSLVVMVESIFLFTIWGSEDAEISQLDAVLNNNVLIIVGEGGTSGGMFIKSAETFKKENGGEIYHVTSGDEFVAAVEDFLVKKGKIFHLEYFGHGNEVGLYVNQQPKVNGALYVNDPELNMEYKAASIYDLPADIFAAGGWIKFNGCNVAKGHPDKMNFAQWVANYFDVDVVAPEGPTEFSKSKEIVDPIENTKFLNPNFDGEVYMVPTYGDKGFLTLAPQKRVEGFVDVRIGSGYEEAVSSLTEKGMKFEEKFGPYETVKYAEAVKYCELAGKGKCAVAGYKDDEKIRNLHALKMLMDSYGIAVKRTEPWYNGYVWEAKKMGVLTEDFTNKKWYTRAEMANLTWNFISSAN